VHRAAASLVELLVTIAVIGVLMGLLLGAIQKVRAASARIDCGNRQKQLTLAMLSYHDAENRLPGLGNGRVLSERFPYLGWIAKLLPFLEQESLARRTDEDYSKRRDPFLRLNPHRNLAHVLPAAGCPADERMTRSWIATAKHDKLTIALSSYLGNSGTNSRTLDGVIYRNSRTQLLHISDGTTNTILLGERPPSPDVLFGWWYAGAGVRDTGVLDFVLNSREQNLRPPYAWYRRCDDGPYHFQARTLDDYCGVFHYWSLHSGGANFAFCDGSVRFLRYEADAVLPALMTRAGGEVVAVE